MGVIVAIIALGYVLFVIIANIRERYPTSPYKSRHPQRTTTPNNHASAYTKQYTIPKPNNDASGNHNIGEWESSLTLVESCNWPEVLLNYKNDKGKKTKRKVDITGIWEGNPGEFYVSGHCHLRNSHRVFKTDRITNPTHPFFKHLKNIID